MASKSRTETQQRSCSTCPKKDLLEHPLGITERPTSMTQPRPREKLGCLGTREQGTLDLAKSGHLCHTAIENLHENQETLICNTWEFFFNSRKKSFLHSFEHLSWEGTRQIRVKNVGSNNDYLWAVAGCSERLAAHSSQRNLLHFPHPLAS